MKPASGAGHEEVLLETAGEAFPMDWSRDGRFLLFERSDASASRDLWILPLGEPGEPRPLVATAADEFQGQFSPDGRWLAYGSNESGRYEIYVQPFPPTDAKWQVSTQGGTQPRWRADSRELYYLAADQKIMALPVSVLPEGLRSGAPQALFQARIGGRMAVATDEFVPAAGGERFLIAMEKKESMSQPIEIVLNWPATLGARP